MPTRASRPTRGSATAPSSGRPPSAKGARQRRAILDALTELLATRPIGELSVADIAAAAGAQRSGYYFYFDSKYAALAVLTSEVWADLMDSAHAFVREDGEAPADFLRRTAGTALRVWKRHEAVLVAAVQTLPIDNAVAEIWRSCTADLAAILTALVCADRDAGRAVPAQDDVSDLVTRLLEMTVHLYYLDSLGSPSAAETDRMIDTACAIWLASAWGSTAL